MPVAARAIALLVLVLLFGAAGLARAADGDAEISDEANFFSAEAKSEAIDVILAIHSLYERDVRIETYPQVPEHLKADLARDGKDKFFEEWLDRRAKALGVRGLFILITRTPGRVQVGVDKSMQRRAFTRDDRDALRDALVTAFRAKRYDQGLLDGLKFVRRRLDETASRDRSPSVPVARAE